MASQGNLDKDNQPPTGATAAVLVPSDELPADAQKVTEIDFNEFAGRPVTVDDLMSRMAHMGFQASSMAEAVRIIDGMRTWRGPEAGAGRARGVRGPAT